MSSHFLAGSPQDLEQALSDVNRKMQEEETKAKAAAGGLPYIDLHNFPVDLNVLGMFAEEEARDMGAVPFYRDLEDLRIGVTDPSHALLQKKLADLKNSYHVSLYMISALSLAQTMKFYRKVMRPKQAKPEEVRIDRADDFPAALKSLSEPGAQSGKTASELIEKIFGAAMSYKASDIHLEPEEHFFKLRLRVDGVLQDVLHLEKGLQKSLLTRLKILSKLKLNVENVPQDGRITFYYLSKPIDVRVSVLPSAFGEEVVMRLLGTGTTGLRLGDMGFRKEQEALIRRLLDRPNGAIFTTGPTGSGKTTTLYAFLNELNQPGVKIITLEDPVEYKMEGIVQTPIDHAAGFDFSKGLRAVLRQDPDVVMVGEIRDQETAEVALQAALTGHMVLSTLHTNDAAGAIPRLINMGVKPFIIGPALSAVLAQRLVRRLCQECRKPALLAPELMEKITSVLKQLPTNLAASLPKRLEFYHSVGCDSCHHLGYQGRLGIYEILEVTEAVEELVMKEGAMSEFKQLAKKQGMASLLQDGLLKALSGMTDVEEVFRVAGET